MPYRYNEAATFDQRQPFGQNMKMPQVAQVRQTLWITNMNEDTWDATKCIFKRVRRSAEGSEDLRLRTPEAEKRSTPSPPRLPPLRIGSQAEEPEAVSHVASHATDADLPLIEARCRLKAEGARWVMARSRRIQEGALYETQIERPIREIIGQARQLGCFLWMISPYFSPPVNLTLIENVTGCFEAAADAVGLVRQILGSLEEESGNFEEALELMAVAQSALRVAIEQVDRRRDTDQQELFRWLHHTTGEHQVYIRRHMRIDDAADPFSWPRIRDRIAALGEKRQQAKRRLGQTKRVGHHVRRILSDGGTAHDWRQITETTGEMLADGTPPSNRDLRNVLLPVIDQIPEECELPTGFHAVLREIDHFLASRPDDSSIRITEAPTLEVQRAAELLQGKSIVLIGGDRRPQAESALKDALALKQLIWLEAREHDSYHSFEPYIARADVALVLLAIRWSSHSFGEVKTFCERYGKPLLRLPGGYNPNRVAHQIVNQCSERLKNTS